MGCKAAYSAKKRHHGSAIGQSSRAWTTAISNRALTTTLQRVNHCPAQHDRVWRLSSNSNLSDPSTYLQLQHSGRETFDDAFSLNEIRNWAGTCCPTWVPTMTRLLKPDIKPCSITTYLHPQPQTGAPACQPALLCSHAAQNLSPTRKRAVKCAVLENSRGTSSHPQQIRFSSAFKNFQCRDPQQECHPSTDRGGVEARICIKVSNCGCVRPDFSTPPTLCPMGRGWGGTMRRRWVKFVDARQAAVAVCITFPPLVMKLTATSQWKTLSAKKEGEKAGEKRCGSEDRVMWARWI